MNRTKAVVFASADARRILVPAVGAFLIVVASSLPTLGQVDTDPGNNSAAGSNSFSLLPGQAISNVAALIGTGNDVDFFSVSLANGHVLLGMTTPLADLPLTFNVPDTMVSVFSAGVPLTFNDDDGADELPLASAGVGSLFRVLAPGAGTYHIGVTGFGDEEFDGDASGDPHAESGRYALTAGVINPAVLGGGFVDTDPTNNAPRHPTNPAVPPPAGFGIPDLISLTGNGAAIAVGELLANDFDFYELHLQAGQVLSVMTAPLDDLGSTFDRPDTHLTLYNSTLAPSPIVFPYYTKLVENEDAGNFEEGTLNPDLASDNPFESFGVYGSALRARIPTTGTYYLSVSTIYGDIPTEVGRYALLVGVALPEPGSIVLMLLGLMSVSSRSWRRTQQGM